MSIQQPWPFYPDTQNVSASFNSSGNLTVNTKFRRVDSYQINLIQPTQAAAFMPYIIQTSKNAGQITAQLLNTSTQISSAISAYIWATGIQ